MDNPSDAEIRRILMTVRTIAVVGFSPKADRPSHRVAAFLQRQGKTVVPVNPGIAGQSALGVPVHASLTAIPDRDRVEMVDVFRQPDFVPAVVDEALAALPGLKVIWMQLGVIHEAAAARARAAGITVVQDRCPAIEWPRLVG